MMTEMNTDLTPADRRRAILVLTANTLAFTVCFAVWMMNGVLITFLVENGVHDWQPREMGWLIGIPVLTGAVFRLPLGIATDTWGGKWVYGLLLLACAVPTYLVSYCNSYWQFFLAGLGFGFCGTSFAVGIAFTSVWFPKNLQGTALGIFGAGNAGAALTTLLAPKTLDWLTNHGEHIEGWRYLPRIYAGLLVVTGVLFLLVTTNRRPPGSARKTFTDRLQPLRRLRVWRFGLYYFFVFGGFVALAQWLVPYYVNVYATSIVLAGMLTSINTLPSGLIRAVGGWLSDRYGARLVMYWVLGTSLICCILLSVPPMQMRTPGRGVAAYRSGQVTRVENGVIVVRAKSGAEKSYTYVPKPSDLPSPEELRKRFSVFPRAVMWQEPIVKVGQAVKRKELLARGVTLIYFQADIWIFTFLSFLLGSAMGIGKAAVYKHIPVYFPQDVGVVGGIVGVLGGLGGFICPIIFGYLVNLTGLWTTCWMFFAVLVAVCLTWMHLVIQNMMKAEAPQAARRIE